MSRAVFSMAEIINLNKARKARVRADDKTQATANRVAHGRTKGQRKASETDRKHLNHVLDGARVERPDDEPA